LRPGRSSDDRGIEEMPLLRETSPCSRATFSRSSSIARGLLRNHPVPLGQQPQQILA
jgi:hypothetical protein